MPGAGRAPSREGRNGCAHHQIMPRIDGLTTGELASLDSPLFYSDYPSFRFGFTSVAHLFAE